MIKTDEQKYHIWTIGCQMNVADSNHVAAELEKIGYAPTDALNEADVVVLNTCVVRQSAENKAIGKLGSLKPWRRSQPNRTLALMGCMVGVKPSQKLMDAYPEVDVFMPPSESSPLINYLRQEEIDAEMAVIEQEQLKQRYQLQDEATVSGAVSDTVPDTVPDTVSTLELDLATNVPSSTTQSIKHLALSGEAPVAAHVPIVYGCSHACTFCIIPFRRGIERSRPIADIVSEIEGLVAQGVREVTLLGQIVDRYGYDWREGNLGSSSHVSAFNGMADGDVPDLADLLHAVHDIDGLWRIRFLTGHPNYMTDRILETVRDLPKVCEHIEVPIQAGDDTVLETMRRGYTSDDYRKLIHRIRKIVPDAAIHTDIIVGFCGETDEQFEQTYTILDELRLDKTHLARYSPRPGTVSARRMADDVPEEVKVARHRRLEALQEEVCGEITSRMLGETVEVLVESPHKGKWRGRTRQNKLVFVESELPLRGRLIEAQVTWTGPWSMQGRFIRDVSPQ
ncbi:MAG: MiaB/RimO family radical SAM methylthiotransferase [Chloroflexota bacterium]